MSRLPDRPVRAGVLQQGPVALNLERSLDRLESLARDADREAGGLDVMVVGETWLPGYPAWIDLAPGAAFWDSEPVKEVFATLRANSVVVPGPVTERIGALARSLGAVLVIGVNERVDEGPGNRTLYNALLTFGSDGHLLNHHRKLVPTFSERLIWGPGDGAGLRAHDTEFGRVGGLICWEHWMPGARQAMHESGEHIHVAVWPTAHDRHQVASRHYAFEGRCFVLAAGQVMRADELPAGLEMPEGLAPDELVMRGGSAIIAPNGDYLAGPVFDDDSAVVAELDLTMIDREVMALDVTGHYHRPDVFGFRVNRDRG